MDTATTLSTGLSAGRIIIGLGLLVAPAKVASPWIGRAASQGATQVAVRGLGARDLALGVATMGTLKATGTRGTGFSVLTGLAVAVDLVDTMSTLAASDVVPGGGTASALVAGGAALAGLIVLAARGSSQD